MNLYLRFFDEEVLVETVDQAIEFLSKLPDVKLSDNVCNELVSYAASKNPFPKRFKIDSKTYFIVIKTTANTMEEFKAYAADVASGAEDNAPSTEKALSGKELLNRTFSAEQPGWYHATMKLKRVMAVEGAANKFCYVDTVFEAKLKAHSVQDCYNRVIDHLRTRADLDPRSQFPSIRGRNFNAEFLGID